MTTSITEADVIREAISRFKSSGGGFTRDAYFNPRSSNAVSYKPGKNVGSTCAIGGIEQAIWKLTGEDVSEDRYESAKVAVPKWQTLYARIMRRLNAKAREMFPTLKHDGEEILTVEELTFVDGERLARKRMLEVFSAALTDLEGS